MAKKKIENIKPIEQYEHTHEERLNNPPVGLVTAHSDNGGTLKKTYKYDPHLDPQLQWAGKTEHTNFEVNTVSLHVHERIDPRRIIETVKKEDTAPKQGSLFEQFQKPLRQAVEFYKHREGWSNRLVAGDSLLVMNSLLEKEGMAGKVQMVYFDPPYGIKYGSNFQPFVNKRDVKDGKDEDLTAEPEMIKAFRDTWELGIHSYLTYLRDRLLLARELLHESGSVFVQISDENVHHLREICDEIFGSSNFISLIPFRKKTMPFGATYLEQMNDFILMYAKSKENLKYRQLFVEKDVRGEQDWIWYVDEKGEAHQMTDEQHQTHYNLPTKAKIFRLKSLEPSGPMEAGMFDYEFKGRVYAYPKNGYGTLPDGLKNLEKKNRLQPKGNLLNYRLFLEDYPYSALTASWFDTVGADSKKYVVQTNRIVVQRCLLMTTDPGDLVLDITCGSGTTAFVAEQWGRRWITCDTSRVAITLAKQRLMTAMFDYYELAHVTEGVGSGFKYKTVPHITLKSIANNEPSPQETLYDQPLVDKKRCRVTGPFTVEAVPSPVAKSFDELETEQSNEADTSISRSGETLRQNEWRDELLRAGVRAKGGKLIEFSRVEPLSGTRNLQAEAETKEDKPKRVIVCFGPEHAPLEQRTVELALEEAAHLFPKPEMVLFCAFQFDEEAAKDIDETNWQGVTLLKAQMNADLLTDDLKKKRSSNESFWLIGQPDVKVISGEWLVDSLNQIIADYGEIKIVSGLDSLAEINKLNKTDLYLYSVLSERRDLWTGFTNAQGKRLDSEQYSRRAGTEYNGRIQTVSGDFERLISRIGDTIRNFKNAEFRSGGSLSEFIKRLCGDKQIIEWITQITNHSPLTTRHLAQVEILGFDYYNPKTGTVESGGKADIAMWLLDTDYDGRSLFPSQVFFPMTSSSEGWSKLAKNLKAEIDEEKIETYRGTVSLPFAPGKAVAVKIIDARGIESLKIIRL